MLNEIVLPTAVRLLILSDFLKKKKNTALYLNFLWAKIKELASNSKIPRTKPNKHKFPRNF